MTVVAPKQIVAEKVTSSVRKANKKGLARRTAKRFSARQSVLFQDVKANLSNILYSWLVNYRNHEWFFDSRITISGRNGNYDMRIKEVGGKWLRLKLSIPLALSILQIHKTTLPLFVKRIISTTQVNHMCLLVELASALKLKLPMIEFMELDLGYVVFPGTYMVRKQNY